jgi:hypothetical protein
LRQLLRTGTTVLHMGFQPGAVVTAQLIFKIGVDVFRVARHSVPSIL